MALKQVWLLIVFGAYVGLIPLFGLSYFVLYRRRQTHFIFAGDIQASRIAEQRQQADDRISWLGVLIEYFEGFATDHRQGIATVEQSRVDTTLTLSDGRAIVLEKHIQHVPPHGANSELAPFVRLLRADHRKDREGRIVGHGFLSDFSDKSQYVLTALEPLQEDFRKAVAHRTALDSPSPQIWRLPDFLYFSTITQSTVGYGDILPNSTAVRAIVMVQIVAAYALLMVVLNIVLGR